MDIVDDEDIQRANAELIGDGGPVQIQAALMSAAVGIAATLVTWGICGRIQRVTFENTSVGPLG